MAKKKRRPEPDAGDDPDPLGKLVAEYKVSLAGVLVVAGVLVAGGAAALGYGLTRAPISPWWAGGGGFAVLIALVLVGTALFNVGRRLELRKLGLRYTDAGGAEEFRWDEIADVRVDRTDSTNMGVATVTRRSDDAGRPSGPLTNTEWEVTVVGHDGRSVTIPPSFFRVVPDPKAVIRQIRMRAGL